MALLAELTYRCPLQCPYCSNPIELARYRNEIETADWLRVLDEAAALGVIHVHFSGGEPLVRRDLEELVRRARARDLYTNLSTGATLADEARLRALREAGLDCIQVSVLDSDPVANDRMAGCDSFARKREAVLAAKRIGFYVTLNVVLHRGNLDRMEEMVELAAQWKVDRIELAHVQYTGWAFINRAALLPSRGQLNRALEIADAARTQLDGRMQILHVLPDYFQEYPKACLNGWGRMFITVAPDGAVLPCQTAREIPGLEFPNVRGRALDDIWFNAPVFNRFRGTDWMPEPCRSCERREIDFGGCRCQAFLLTGDAAATDPVCRFSPHHSLIENQILAPSGEAAKLTYRVMRGSGGVE
ncbi:pyrroloquinoline quinone biosynthesis protein PqqE [Candidatus Sumerlaeota bacterium]|nr:pyrroloquinoline quinone biosynthesis protein PqqE [Candidatus Sumerlaeota bacterium]